MAGNKKDKKDKVIDVLIDDLSKSDPSKLFGGMSGLEPKPHSTGLSKPEGLQSNIFQTKINMTSSEKTAIVEPPDQVQNNIKVDEEFSSNSEKTMVIGAHRVHSKHGDIQEKTSFGSPRSNVNNFSSGPLNVTDAQVQLAENLKLAQDKILDLEKETELLRSENEKLFSENNFNKNKSEELERSLSNLEKEKSYQIEQYQSELEIFRDSAKVKENEIIKLRDKTDSLESRLKVDLRKIRVKERELENRLEILKMEKEALLRTKDENILDLKRKIDQLNHELENYRSRVTELNQKIEQNHDQLSRTVKALRLALTNLEVNDSLMSATLAPLKKAE